MDSQQLSKSPPDSKKSLAMTAVVVNLIGALAFVISLLHVSSEGTKLILGFISYTTGLVFVIWSLVLAVRSLMLKADFEVSLMIVILAPCELTGVVLLLS